MHFHKSFLEILIFSGILFMFVEKINGWYSFLYKDYIYSWKTKNCNSRYDTYWIMVF